MIDVTYYPTGKTLVRDVFVETGYWEGNITQLAIKTGFREVWSIESHHGRYLDGVEKFRREPRVRVVYGTSPVVLPRILSPNRRTTFYLDAHYMGEKYGPPDPVYGECPLLAELDAIFKGKWTLRPAVAIDDARLFDRPWPDSWQEVFDVSQWPTAEEVRAAFPGDYVLVTHNDVTYGVPPEW